MDDRRHDAVGAGDAGGAPPGAEPAEVDVAVVGAGIAGLVAAARAARAGAGVVLLDGHPAGGRARSTEREGFTLNQGPHGLYDHGAFRRALDDLDVAVHGGPPLVDRGSLWSGGRAHRLPAGPAGLIRTSVVGPRAKAQLARLLAVAPRLDPDPWATTTFEGWLDHRGLGEDARRLVRMLVRIATYADAPDQLSADAAVAQLQLSLRGVTYVDGGWQSLVDGLVAAAERAGVACRTGAAAAVRGVEADGDRWRVVSRDGVVRARALVLAAGGPAACAGLLERDPGWVDGAGPAIHASCLDLGLRRPATRGILFGVEEPLYLSTHTPPAALAPAGASLVQVMRNHRPGEELDHDAVRAELWTHAGRAGISPGDVLVERYLHRLTVTHGLPLAERGGLSGRPSVDVPGEPGLFVAGDWVGDRGVLADAAAASGTRAAELAVAHARASSVAAPPMTTAGARA
ncbi:MAG: FAD-dependent oxidoreductase [Acidimicrobiales bacterium]